MTRKIVMKVLLGVAFVAVLASLPLLPGATAREVSPYTAGMDEPSLEPVEVICHQHCQGGSGTFTPCVPGDPDYPYNACGHLGGGRCVHVNTVCP